MCAHVSVNSLTLGSVPSFTALGLNNGLFQTRDVKRSHTGPIFGQDSNFHAVIVITVMTCSSRCETIDLLFKDLLPERTFSPSPNSKVRSSGIRDLRQMVVWSLVDVIEKH